MSELYVGVSLSDGTVAHLAIQMTMRAPKHPGAAWTLGPNGYTREDTDSNIEYEVSRQARNWAVDGKTVVSWRRLSQAEHDLFSQNRWHRNALEEVNGTIQYNMPKARALHREMLRHYNGGKLILLDRDWVNASVSKDTVAVKAVEDKRAALAASVVDPRIEAAQTLAELLQVTPVEA